MDPVQIEKRLEIDRIFDLPGSQKGGKSIRHDVRNNLGLHRGKPSV